jgi:hypothetical protein
LLKIIDFDLTTERESKVELSDVVDTTPGSKKEAKKQEVLEGMKTLSDSLSGLNTAYSNYHRDVRFFQIRERRNFETVKSTEGSLSVFCF